MRVFGEVNGIGQMVRHTFAHSWLAEGGNEGDLMRITGWKSRSMVNRDGASAADERARNVHRRRGPRRQAVAA